MLATNAVRANVVYDQSIYKCSGHMWLYLQPELLKERLRLAKRALSTHTFDTLAFRGMSGAFIGPTLAARMQKNMILVRKDGDSTHSLFRTEGFKAAQRYIIVDDFIDSGDTKRATVQAVSEFAPDACFVGLLEVTLVSEEALHNCEITGTRYPLK